MTPSLWRHRGFRLLWSARTTSNLGSQIGMLAIPLTAVIDLSASAMQVSVLVAANFLPWLVLGPVAGVLVDRYPRRSTMIITDMARFGLLLTIPIAMALGVLSYAQLAFVAFGCGLSGVFFDTANSAFLPVLLPKDRLSEGNAKLSASTSVSNSVGPGLGGALVQALTAPVAIVADAVSFLASAWFLRGISHAETPPPPAERRRIGVELREGAGFILRHPILRALAGEATTSNLGASMNGAIVVLFATRELHLSAGQIGIALSFSGIGGVVATLLTSRVSRCLGVGLTVLGSSLCTGAGALLVPLSQGGPALAVSTLAAAYFFWGGSLTCYGIAASTLRQTITPLHLQGRTMATANAVSSGVNPIGAILGGLLGTWLGLRPTLLLAAALIIGSGLWIARSPLLRVRSPHDVPQISLEPLSPAAVAGAHAVKRAIRMGRQV